MSGKKYTKYSPDDFAANELFQRWILKGDNEAKVFWENWMLKYPQKEVDVLKAKEILKRISALKFKEYQCADDEMNQVLATIVQQPLSDRRFPFLGTPKAFARVAAIITLLIAAAVVLYKVKSNSIIRYNTGYNEMAEIILPDSSTVWLDANSEIWYSPDWSKTREVHLSGVGFFSVIHLESNKKFFVHADEMSVEVLGTKFEIKNRRGKTRVVLQEGSVKLDIPTTSQPDDLIMKPGELIEYSVEEEGIILKNVNASTYTAWIRNELIFENTPLREVAETIEDIYGYAVTFDSPELPNRTLTAKISNKSDINLLIDILEEVFNLKIHKNDKELEIMSE